MSRRVIKSGNENIWICVNPISMKINVIYVYVRADGSEQVTPRRLAGTRCLNSQSEKFDWLFLTNGLKRLPLNSGTTTDMFSVVKQLVVLKHIIIIIIYIYTYFFKKSNHLKNHQTMKPIRGPSLVDCARLFLFFQTDSIMFRPELTICCCSLF